MLSGMRSFARSKWALVIILLLVAGLAFTMGDPLSGVTGGGFMRAGEHSLGARDVNRALNRQIERIRREEDRIITIQEAHQQGLSGQVLNDLLQEKISLAFADKIGVRASPAAVADVFLNQPGFKDAFGQVNVEAVARIASDQGLSVRELEREIRNELTVNYIQSNIVAGVKTPQIITRPLAIYLGERRDLVVARPTDAAIGAPPEPTAEQLKKEYDDHIAQFVIPEMRAISILTYSAADYIDKVDLPEARLRSEYERRIKEFSGPETRVITQLIATDRNALQSVVDTVKSGTPLADAVKRTPGVGMSELTVKPGELANKDYDQLAFAAPPNELVGPFDFDRIWYTIQVKTVTPGPAMPFEQVSGQLRTELATGEARRMFTASGEEFETAVASGATLEELAAEIGAPILRLEPVAPNGAPHGGGPNSLLAAHSDALAQMFQAQVGEMTEVIEAPDARAVMRLDAIVPSRTPPLEEVRDQVHAMYMSETVQRMAQEAAQRVIDGAKAGKPFDRAAADARFEVVRAPGVLRPGVSQNQPGQDPALIMGAFDLAAGTPGIVSDQRGVPHVVLVESAQPLNPETDAQFVSMIETRYRELIARDIFEVYGRGVQKEVKVNINEKNIQAYMESLAPDPDEAP